MLVILGKLPLVQSRMSAPIQFTIEPFLSSPPFDLPVAPQVKTILTIPVGVAYPSPRLAASWHGGSACAPHPVAVQPSRFSCSLEAI